MENLIIAFDCVIPVFLNLFVGYYAKRNKIIPEAVFPKLNTLSFHVLLPMLVFSNLYSSDYSGTFPLQVPVYIVFMTLLFFFSAVFFTKRQTKDYRRRGAFLQNSFRSNIGIMGLPLAASLNSEADLATTTISIAILIPIYNILGVIALESCSGKEISAKKMLRGIITNPIVISTIIGLISVAIGVRLPLSVSNSISSMGKAGAILSLMTLGASLTFDSMRSNKKQLFWACTTRLVILPVIAIALAMTVGFQDNMLIAVLIVFATPTATVCYTMAQAYDSDYELSGQMVVTSSLVSCGTLFTLIFSLKQMGAI